jgi:hypothetical protein
VLSYQERTNICCGPSSFNTCIIYSLIPVIADLPVGLCREDHVTVPAFFSSEGNLSITPQKIADPANQLNESFDTMYVTICRKCVESSIDRLEG